MMPVSGRAHVFRGSNPPPALNSGAHATAIISATTTKFRGRGK